MRLAAEKYSSRL